MRSLLIWLCLLHVIECENFLTFSKAELCEAEPHLSMCRRRALVRQVESFQSEDTKQRKEGGVSGVETEGFIPVDSSEVTKRAQPEPSLGGTAEDNEDNPFEDIVTRAPLAAESNSRTSPRKKHFGTLQDYYMYRQQEYEQQQRHSSQNGLLYRVYPGLHPKDSSYCPNMRGMFVYTCQPSKPLRLDLVEFCKDYSAFCDVPNFHRLPGPRIGPASGDAGTGHIGVNGKFGFGVGAVPGLDVGVGWGVDVGPLPGLGESVGVGLGLDLGIMGAKSPEAFRRGQDNPNEKGGGIVGLSGGVGVKAPGTDGIGVGSGIGVGK